MQQRHKSPETLDSTGDSPERKGQNSEDGASDSYWTVNQNTFGTVWLANFILPANPTYTIFLQGSSLIESSVNTDDDVSQPYSWANDSGSYKSKYLRVGHYTGIATKKRRCQLRLIDIIHVPV
ncbi:hypothetical protein PISL3812_01503 [Talaromyces islandicus]|uniref:Uncharacterized protein n=1 Tax=Talaromyces islandicus TaxID=28573 RepID=A0A0U1LMI2_TALIS|nr:hypothetical protein PISL3812_01503 [Talaromyces islandicus]